MNTQPLTPSHLKLPIAFVRNTYLACRAPEKRAYWHRVLRTVVLKTLRDRSVLLEQYRRLYGTLCPLEDIFRTFAAQVENDLGEHEIRLPMKQWADDLAVCLR